MKKYRINKYLSLKLEEGNTNIYIKGKLFQQCKHLILKIPLRNKLNLDDINSIDEAAEKLDHDLEESINPCEEFWAHCSNLQVWAENNYDSRLLHSNLTFPLLKKLSEVRDPKALSVFKEEIIYRFFHGTEKVQEYLIEEGYLDLITDEEKYSLIESESDLRALQEIQDEVGTKLQIVPSLKEIENSYYSDFFKSFALNRGKIVGLRLCKCNINKIPEAVKKFQNLETFILCADDSIKIIPSWIEEISNLKELTFRGLNIKDFPQSIGNLTSLKKLNLSNNKLVSLPESLKNLHNLKKLDLRYNSLRSLPERFGNLANLKKLDMNYRNLLSTLPESFGNLKSLEILRINKNKLIALPESFGNLESLKGLELENNQLRALPKSMENLKSLEYINLNNNEFEDFPECLIQCKNLKRIYLSRNKMKKVPQSIAKNNIIEVLGLRNNEIKKFPDFLLNMKSLKKLDLKYNPIRDGYIANPKIEVTI